MSGDCGRRAVSLGYGRKVDEQLSAGELDVSKADGSARSGRAEEVPCAAPVYSDHITPPT